MTKIAGAGDRQHVRAPVQGPGEAYLVRRHAARGRERLDGLALPQLRTAFAPSPGDREERRERDSPLAAGREERVIAPPGVDSIRVLYAHHGRDPQRLLDVVQPYVGQPQMPD